MALTSDVSLGLCKEPLSGLAKLRCKPDIWADSHYRLLPFLDCET